MGEEANLSTAAPPGEFPKMEVGVNQPFRWIWERYGQNFGPPLGGGGNPPEAKEFWRDIAPVGLEKLKELGVTVVRLFILGNAFNYGPEPTPEKVARYIPPVGPHPGGKTESTEYRFNPPDDEKTLNPFFEHFETMLNAFRRAEMKVMPCVIDFQAFIEPIKFQGGGARADLIRDSNKRDIFIETMLNGLLAVAGGYRDQIYAWDAFNEPIHLVTPISKYVYGDGGLHGSFLPLSKVQDFIRAILKKIDDRTTKYETTVGHRLKDDFSDYRPYSFGSTCLGSKRQFHYYHTVKWGVADDSRLPKFADTNAILGEFGSSPFRESADELWKEDLDGADADSKNTVFERLSVAAGKGYKLAMAWPNGGKDDSILGFTQEARESIKRFTHTRFPNGVPRVKP